MDAEFALEGAALTRNKMLLKACSDSADRDEFPFKELINLYRTLDVDSAGFREPAPRSGS
jgi:hypothetical protein